MLVCAAVDPKTPASHPLFCQRAVDGMASFLTFPCPLLQLRAVSPSRPQLLHFWGDVLCKEPIRLPSSSGQLRFGHRDPKSNRRGRASRPSCRAAKPPGGSTLANFGAASTRQAADRNERQLRASPSAWERGQGRVSRRSVQKYRGRPGAGLAERDREQA